MTGTKENAQEKTILVLGGTGKTGRRVAERVCAARSLDETARDGRGDE